MSKTQNEAAILADITINEAKERLVRRKVSAVYAEKVTEEYFHYRNATRANRLILKDKSVTCIGVGALGSYFSENLAKAGIGKIYLVDKEILKVHNVIRHTCNIPYVGWLKTKAVAWDAIALHNPFVKAEAIDVNILNNSIDSYFNLESIGISTIADDFVEGYLNERSIQTERLVFYARALRGGKAARIFRVKPGVDACKECLALYREEKRAFIDLPDDPSLPPLINECNNPIRQGSAADMSVIASLLSSVVIDYLQNPVDDYNHWIWYTEELPGLTLNQNQSGVCYKHFIPPHPKCRLCQRIELKEVLIAQESVDHMRGEAVSAGRVETGGILIGFRNITGNLVVTKSTGPGPNAICREDAFERDVEYCQQQLKESSEELQGDGKVTSVNEPSWSCS